LKIGVFGGAFDPPHNGHVNLITSAANRLKFDKTLIIPTWISPHKSGTTVPFSDRFAMAELAFGLSDSFLVSDIEKNSSGYTIDTLKNLREKFPCDEFFLIIGGDMLSIFDKWKDYRQILKSATVVAAARADNYSELVPYAEKLGVLLLDLPIVPVSSTYVRGIIAQGGDTNGLLTEKVREYIKSKGLYGCL
jgi:nicotinate-nucleotide adenylyltransferase